MTRQLGPRVLPTTLLHSLIEAPDIVPIVRALPGPTFAALVKYVGLEDAGEIVALATTEQLVAAFDEDLFVSSRPGEREELDAERFALWLEVLLEAGDEVAAGRVAELSEDFVVHALSSLLLVLDDEALRLRMSEGGSAARRADKAIESSLSEEIDGYLLLALRPSGWDAVLALILALDRDHRPLLVRLLDRCAALASEYTDDLLALTEVLTAAESLADDVEGERELRRSRQGYVEPRAARSFLALARAPLERGSSPQKRDPITRAYFRELAREPGPAASRPAGPPAAQALTALLSEAGIAAPALPALPAADPATAGPPALAAALRQLQAEAPRLLAARLEELAYLANLLMAGTQLDGCRLRLPEATEAVVATVTLGAELCAREGRSAAKARRRPGAATPAELCAVLREWEADLLFRRASRALAGGPKTPAAARGFLRSLAELDAARAGAGAAAAGRPSR